jgi:hypothetical protein
MTDPIPVTPVPAPVGPAHPWRRVARTILANLGAFAVTVPIIVNAMGIDPNDYPQLWWILGGITAVSAALTRILAIPQVDTWLKHTITFLSADDVAAESVAAIRTGDQYLAGPAAIYEDGSEVAVTPLPVNGPDVPRRAVSDLPPDITDVT